MDRKHLKTAGIRTDSLEDSLETLKYTEYVRYFRWEYLCGGITFSRLVLLGKHSKMKWNLEKTILSFMF